jgi:CxxC motif-containing protein (DUF1111 family)
VKLSRQSWILIVAILALAPIGLRALTWAKARKHAEDVAMAREGQVLFQHEWTKNDPLANGGDGLGPVFNANSCAVCHHQGGVGGAGGLQHNVTVFTVKGPGSQSRQGVVHAKAIDQRFQETLKQVDPNLPAISQPTLGMILPPNNMMVAFNQPVMMHPNGPGDNNFINPPNNVHLSQRNTPALFGARLIDEIPDRVIIAQERMQRLRWGLATAESEEVPVGRALRQADGRISHFGWKAQTASLSDFVRAACANELGLSNPSQPQPTPLGMPNYRSSKPGLDLTDKQCDQLTAFVASLPRPTERVPDEGPLKNQAHEGKKIFNSIGCADCHTPSLGGVDGIYSDLLLHRMGQDLVGGGSYGQPPVPLPDVDPSDGPKPDEWRTPPLWGVADSAPYLHDGRAPTLKDAIALHRGQAARSSERFAGLKQTEQNQLIVFLQTLRAP